MFEQDEESRLAGQERELVRALMGLKPAPAGFTPREIRAAAHLSRQRRQTRIWQAVAAAVAVGAATLALVRPPPPSRAPPRIVYVTVENPPAPSPPVSPVISEPARAVPAGFAYLQMRERALLLGAEAFGVSRPAVTSTHGVRSARWSPGGVDPLSDEAAAPPDALRRSVLDLLMPGGKT